MFPSRHCDGSPKFGRRLTFWTSYHDVHVNDQLRLSLQIHKRDEAITQLQSDDKELLTRYKAACGRAEEAEKAREALQSEYENIVEELKSHETAMASLEEKIKEEGGKREEELSRCQKVIEELKQQLVDSEQGRVEQQQKVMVVNGRCSFVHVQHGG